ncbi:MULTISPECIES: DUF5331 domain-containing protein [Planktothrix]|jgi:hypothetical protein|uniref:DUF5331 domain-containing protein n=4 Tax=Planktothrix TaxID=54304 RepID=A0A6J7ZIB9_PLARU|nr:MULTISPECIES: DUF5331 domain-containing protein [Planktothrix]MCF3607799.1 DUF5331 domain-containing protein [Planktothrix agardhii 1033]CAC5341558.1 conserved hypothetical protein [Planktothrix rubescens NIVA-CYA 18]CAD5931273.1 hypothetical protein PCC7821_01298 [Planktothrix rubescens NIVA-CYA 18]CAH2571845.1 hypothetical protein PRNO82_01249 [Planktothrix rubescens]
MAFFKDFSVALKDKWLQYYQANRDWLVLQMDLNSIPTPDGGRRPASSLILGTINALDPEAAQLMLPFSRLNPDPEKLIEVLGLHFDPDLALAGRSTSEQPATVAVPAYQAPAVAPGYAPSPEIPLFVAKAVPGYHHPAPPETLSLEEDITPAQTLNVAGAVAAVAGATAVVGVAAVMEKTQDDFNLEYDDLGMGDLGLDIDTETANIAEEDFELGLEDESESLGTDDLDMDLESDDLDMSLESDELESDDLDMSLESDELESDDLDMSLESDELESDDLDMSLESDELESNDLDFGLESETTSAELDINTDSDVWGDDVQTELGEENGLTGELDLSLDASDDLGLDGMDDFGLEADELGSEGLGGLELGDTDSGLDDDLGDFGLEDSSSNGLGLDAGGDLDDLGLGDDDLGEFNLDDMGDLTTGDMDDIDIEGLTGSSDDDEISLSDFK